MTTRSRKLQLENTLGSLHHILRREFLINFVCASSLLPLQSCRTAIPASEASRSPVDDCRYAGYSLLYYGFTGDTFHILDMCGSADIITDKRFSAFSPVRIVGVGNGGDRLVVGNAAQMLKTGSLSLYIYDMEKLDSVKVDDFPGVHQLRLSADGNAIAGIEADRFERGRLLRVVLCYASLAKKIFKRIPLKLQTTEDLPRNIGLSADGRVIVYSDKDNMLRVDVDSGEIYPLGFGRNASCSPDGKYIAYTNIDGKLAVQSLLDFSEVKVFNLSAVDGLEWYPTGGFGVAAEPSWIPPLGAPRPDNLYLVDVNQIRWRRLTSQRGWIGATSLRWIKQSIQFQKVLDKVYSELIGESGSEDWLKDLLPR